ncbi:trace amine-associated receptor 1-like [Halichoeres trimaculatus]|uniref:trace amine-associated receptor 1-like n=1 Tax=Halichoeres trimaculatus TaxID=147232 RepID=UPI003D9EA2D7
MGPEVSDNRTITMTDFHPCYEMHDFSYILSKTPSVICVLLYSFLFLVSVVCVCGNLLVIISIIYFKQLHSPTNFLILSLAVADILVGIVVFPLSMVFSLSSCLFHEDLSCKIRTSFDISLGTCSILNLCCISIDRYYAVCQPLTYKAKINHRITVLMILVCWGGSALIGIGVVLAGLSNEVCDEVCFVNIFVHNTIATTLSFYLPVIIMLCIYLKILLVAQKQASRILNKMHKCAVTVSKTERKATKTLAIVLGVFLSCWTPFFLCITFPPLSNPAPVSVMETVNWLGLSNSMLNPFIYAFFYSWFRSAIRMILSGKLFRGDFTNTKLQ